MESIQIQVGKMYFDRGDYEHAREQYYAAAQTGSPDAQILLAEMYFFGFGTAVDYDTAIFWYTQAANQGNPHAQYALGTFYANGRGVSINYTTAVYWWEKAAAQGHRDAQANLGVCYESGMGVEPDMQKAFDWWVKAAKQGDGNSQYYVGITIMDKEKLGRKPSLYELQTAAGWLKKAYANGVEGSGDALELLNRMLESEVANLDSTTDSFSHLRRKSDAAAEYIQTQRFRRWIQGR